MTDLNKVYLIGRITRDSVLERTSETVYAKFSIAVNKDVKTANGNYESVPAYIDLAIFDNYAEKMYTYLRKGTLILVEGSIKPRQWSKDDVKINTLGVSVKKIQLLSSSKSATANSDKESGAKEVVNSENFVEPVPVNSENFDPSDEQLEGVF